MCNLREDSWTQTFSCIKSLRIEPARQSENVHYTQVREWELKRQIRSEYYHENHFDFTDLGGILWAHTPRTALLSYERRSLFLLTSALNEVPLHVHILPGLCLPPKQNKGVTMETVNWYPYRTIVTSSIRSYFQIFLNFHYLFQFLPYEQMWIISCFFIVWV